MVCLARRALKAIVRAGCLPLFTTSEVRHEGQTLTLVSEDPQAGLRLQSEIALDASGVLSVRHGVTNLRASPAGRWIAWRSHCRSPNALAR